jgi:metal-sulfur cluster biosynthetic enzyme
VSAAESADAQATDAQAADAQAADAQAADGAAPESAEPSPFVTEPEVTEALKDVIDPELGINVVDLGLVYGVTVEEGNAVVDMTLTSAACPLTDVLEEQTFAALDPICESHRINWVWMPPWGMEMITEDGREQLRAIGFNL